jgi:hypothetical protein
VGGFGGHALIVEYNSVSIPWSVMGHGIPFLNFMW